MVVRGTVSNGVVVLEGGGLPDGTVVNVTPAGETPTPTGPVPAGHPAMGVWRDRTDLPDDPVDASRALRERMMRRGDE